MSISYPISMPSTPEGVRSVRFSATNIVGIAASPFTAQAQVYEWPGEFWSLDIALPPMRREDAEAWLAWLVALRGVLGTFHIGDPLGDAPQGIATGTPLVNGAHSAGSKTVATKGWTHNVTGILKAGDYVQIGTGAQQRLYKVLTDANSDSSGHATLDIFPRLREGLSDNQSVTTSNTAGTFRLATNTREWTADETLLYGVNFKAVEAL
jgi:hypothetical protein